jgi:hypothetical protein
MNRLVETAGKLFLAKTQRNAKSQEIGGRCLVDSDERWRYVQLDDHSHNPTIHGGDFNRDPPIYLVRA